MKLTKARNGLNEVKITTMFLIALVAVDVVSRSDCLDEKMYDVGMLSPIYLSIGAEYKTCTRWGYRADLGKWGNPSTSLITPHGAMLEGIFGDRILNRYPAPQRNVSKRQAF